MANTAIYVRDSITGIKLALKAMDNGDGSYTLGSGAGDASQVTSLAIKAKTDLIPADITTQLDTNLPAIQTLLNYLIIATGTFTTSSATLPADTGKGALATHYYDGCLILPLTGVCALQPRRITTFTTTTGVYTLAVAYTAAPGLVNYVLLASQP
jgi:hypothetical protein